MRQGLLKRGEDYEMRIYLQLTHNQLCFSLQNKEIKFKITYLG